MRGFSCLCSVCLFDLSVRSVCSFGLSVRSVCLFGLSVRSVCLFVRSVRSVCSFGLFGSFGLFALIALSAQTELADRQKKPDDPACRFLGAPNSMALSGRTGPRGDRRKCARYRSRVIAASFRPSSARVCLFCALRLRLGWIFLPRQLTTVPVHRTGRPPLPRGRAGA